MAVNKGKFKAWIGYIDSGKRKQKNHFLTAREVTRVWKEVNAAKRREKNGYR